MQTTHSARGRLSMLILTGGLAAVLVACGRASPADIDAALGITPTATLSAEQIVAGTEQAITTSQTRTAAQASIASPVAGESVELAAAGDAGAGSSVFRYCVACHAPAGGPRGPSLSGPDNPSVALSDQELFDLIREGEGHPVPPGPYTTATITDRQLIDLLAYLREQSK